MTVMAACLLLLATIGCARPRPQTAPPAAREAIAAHGPSMIPWPVSVSLSEKDRLTLGKDVAIEVSPGQPDLQRIGRDLAELLRPALDAQIPVREGAAGPASAAIRLEVGTPAQSAGEESYELTITATGVRIVGASPAGVFYGVQTLRQLLPASVEYRGALAQALPLPQGRIVDHPRYGWRGAMLDVARHFFTTADVKRFIDQIALYKFNRLHLHLTDDQGWRIEIASWPRLTAHGASTQVGGGLGGFYTKQDFADLIAYAKDRFITIVPEIEMPSHINAALVSYPDLDCSNIANPALYSGIEVGFSAICVDKDVTYKFLDDVIRELAEMTPGPHIHIGGDEVKKLTQEQYDRFIERVQEIVEAHGKTTIGWDEIAHARLRPATVVQYWRPDASIKPAPGTNLILSPANRIYLDMKYDAATVLGLDWAGKVDVSVPYEWDPATLLPGVPDSSILGVETPIWSETVVKMADVEFLAFPRIAAVAEVAWSPQSSRNWSQFRTRLGAQAPRWSALGINAFWSPKIDWQR
jgi:hexosaminidase